MNIENISEEANQAVSTETLNTVGGNIMENVTMFNFKENWNLVETHLMKLKCWNCWTRVCQSSWEVNQMVTCEPGIAEMELALGFTDFCQFLG
jgi:hypothetical protein